MLISYQLLKLQNSTLGSWKCTWIVAGCIRVPTGCLYRMLQSNRR